ncbi:MAG TPA: PKD domain-containing protein [Thermoplasmata archaeon]|nr:PKD domain-containing protein [Thermoplasmata archaeon]
MLRWAGVLAVVIALGLTGLPTPGPGSSVASPSAAHTAGSALLGEARASLNSNLTVWSRDPTTRNPGMLSGELLVYDASDGYVLLFGGQRSFSGLPAAYLSATWKFSSGVWTELYPPIHPTIRFGMAGAYDPVDGYVVMYGGGAVAYGFAQTWTFHAGVWTELSPHRNPGHRGEVQMVWDPALQSVVLFGGLGADNSTWAFRAGQWKELPTTVAPAPRRLYSLAWDGRDNAVLLFGGLSDSNTSSTLFNDTWEFKSGSWTERHPAVAPAAQTGAAMAFDPDLDKVLLVDSGSSNDSWTYSNGVWSRLAFAVAPVGRSQEGLAFDHPSGELVLYGGYSCANSPGCNSCPRYGLCDDTWEFGRAVNFSFAANWTNLTSVLNSTPPRVTGSMAFDSAMNVTVWYGAGHTETYSDGEWTDLPNAGTPENGAGNTTIAYDAADGYVVLFGGLAGGFLGDTWVFEYGSWRWLDRADHGSTCYTDPPVDSTTGPCPPPSAEGVMAYDTADGYLIYNGSWKFVGGVWSPLAASEPNITALTYDAADGYVLALNASGGTLSYHAGVWTVVSRTGGPGVRRLEALAYDPIVRAAVLFGGIGIAYYGAFFYEDTWEYRAGNWTNVTWVVGPSSRAGAAMAYDPADGYLLLFGGFGTQNYAVTYRVLNSTWVYSERLLTIAEARPTMAVPGQSISFEGEWAGGPPPTSFRWTFGDGTGSSLPAANHSFASVGSYVATFYANATGNSTSSPGSVSVTIVPSRLSIIASADPVDENTSITLSAWVDFGTPPYSYNWSANGTSPDNSASTNASASFTFLAPGVFPVRLTVSDSLNTTVTAERNMTVDSDPSSANLSVVRETTDTGVPDQFTIRQENGTPPYEYAWKFGDSPAPVFTNDPSVNHTYSSPGSFLVTAWANDSGGGSTHASRSVTVVDRPSVTIQPGSADAATPIRFSESASGGVAPFSAIWMFGDGSVGSGLSPSHTYSDAGVFSVTLNWTDAVGVSAQVIVPVVVNPSLAVSLRPSNDSPVVGQELEFTASASGGRAPFVYSWAAVPAGCAPDGPSALTCRPLLAGAYSADVLVSDANSAGASAAANVTVLFGIAVEAPAAIVEGSPLVISVDPLGGISPLHFSYSGLPAGCEPADVPHLTCTPTQSGLVRITVHANDAAGNSASGQASIDVEPRSGSPAPVDSAPPSWVLWFGAGTGALVAAIAGAWWLARRRRDSTPRH